MRQRLLDSRLIQGAFWLVGISYLFAILAPPCDCSDGPTSHVLQGQLTKSGSLDTLELTQSDLVTAISPKNLPKSQSNAANPTGAFYNAGRHKQATASGLETHGARNKARRHEVLSEDCFAKRDEVMKRQSHTGPGQVRPTPTAIPSVGFQKIKPRVESPTNPITLNITLANNFDGEHVPRCQHDGTYNPIQCHKIGYCWCVNKFGQAIKNSAVAAGEEPECDPSMYESDGNNRFVIANISAQRANTMLRNESFFGKSSTPNGHISLEATEPTPMSESSDHDAGPHPGPNGTHGPVMPLIPNDCSGSRASARERAATQINDSIWVPECDIDDEKLYAEQQCHKSRVCWCVDQTTGLPLRTSEQLSSRPVTHNCTEIKRILGVQPTKPRSSSAPKQPQQQQQQQPHQTAFYQGSSEYCDTDKRLEFVITLNNQFRQQISEYLRQNPSSQVPSELSSANPYLISESQVAKWKFSIMDRDMDGKIGDREWSKFKNNFKLVDKVSELDNPYKQQKSPYFSLTPLLIVRSQRKCWRDFLEFCGNGELVDESISLSMWMGCTEVPSKLDRDERTRTALPPSENTYALSREAAIVRSQKKNPFLGILKPD